VPPVEVASGPDVILEPGISVVPGEIPVARLGYRSPKAGKVFISGSWSHWRGKHAMTLEKSVWVLDVSALRLPRGRHEFKFRPDGEWESGPNRIFHVNEQGLLERPPDVIAAAVLESPTRIDVHFKIPVANPSALDVSVKPDVPLAETSWSGGEGDPPRYGYAVAGDIVTFCFEETRYGVALTPAESVYVAGTFNGWNSKSAQWRLTDRDDDGKWEGTFALPDVAQDSGSVGIQFKFVVNGERWMSVPGDAPNRASHDGHTNLALVPTASEAPTLVITTSEPLLLSNAYEVVVAGLDERVVHHPVTPGAFLDDIRSDKPLGAILDRDTGLTVFRVFAPRASRVDLCHYCNPDRTNQPPWEVVPMQLEPGEGTWTTTYDWGGDYYGYRVDGPAGPGEGFDYEVPIGDPYARASAHSHDLSILVDPEATNRWFTGWTDGDYTPPAWEDVLIYETHVRDLTIDPSAGVAPELRGRYGGITAAGLDGLPLQHLRELGVNMIEFLPVAEFANGTNEHGWGYNTAYYFAPEASYGSDPLRGSQYYEFKTLVNELHRQGFGVILDVVYNHVGSPNVFYTLDRKYYFRQGLDFTLSNFSGCGNDVRTEAPMMRRLIVDNVLYWMREHHVDGFRFDLCELIDMETIRLVEQEARKLNPDVLLISEPWSFRGDHKLQLKGTGWAAWNDQFRDITKRFARGEAEREPLQKVITGSVETWAAHPMQTVNYIESHDDRCLADELTSNANHDGRIISAEDAARHRLAATVLFTSLGIPMLAEGQEYIRSKQGIKNTYNKGDAINALRWTDRERPAAATTQAYYRDLARLRRSDAGAAFRMRGAPPKDYYQWIHPGSRGALGYVVNARKEHAGASFVVLLNSTRRTLRFDVRFPGGKWRLVGDGTRIDTGGIEDSGTRASAGGIHSVSVPAVSSKIYVGL
jgi:pullulanase